MEVLLAHHRHPERAFWCFPGGGVEPDERFDAAAMREALEETGLSVELDGVCFVQDRPEADSVELFFAGRAVEGSPVLGGDPERGALQPPVLDDLEWVPLHRLQERNVLPAGLAAALEDGSYFGWGRLPLPSAE